MRGDIDTEKAEEMEANAKSLIDAAQFIGEMLDSADEMVDDGSLPDDEQTAAFEDDMETARATCKRLSFAITASLIEGGYVPDYSDDDSDDDGGARSGYVQ